MQTTRLNSHRKEGKVWISLIFKIGVRKTFGSWSNYCRHTEFLWFCYPQTKIVFCRSLTDLTIITAWYMHIQGQNCLGSFCSIVGRYARRTWERSKCVKLCKVRFYKKDMLNYFDRKHWCINGICNLSCLLLETL